MGFEEISQFIGFWIMDIPSRKISGISGRKDNFLTEDKRAVDKI